MYDKQLNGHIIFKFKSEPNFIRPGSKCEELVVARREDGKVYVAIRRNFANGKRALIDVCEDSQSEGDIDCKAVKELNPIQAEQIIKIIENNKELINVNSEIKTNVLDGSHEEFYFECSLFNRFTEGDSVFDLYGFCEQLQSFEELEKNVRDAIIVSSAVKKILFYLESIGIYLYEEDNDYLLERKEELKDYLIKASESTSMFYPARKDNKDDYWPSFKLYVNSGILFMTSKNRMFDFIKVPIPEWMPYRDVKIIEEICNGDNFVWCESHENNGEVCYTISLKNKFDSIEKN